MVNETKSEEKKWSNIVLSKWRLCWPIFLLLLQSSLSSLPVFSIQIGHAGLCPQFAVTSTDSLAGDLGKSFENERKHNFNWINYNNKGVTDYCHELRKTYITTGTEQSVESCK